MLQKIDGVPFQIQKPFDFSFLKEYGRLFCVLDGQDSGNICFGTELNGSRYFIKFAGAQPVRYSGDPADTVQRLQSASAVWAQLRHENLVQYISSFTAGGGFGLVFQWTDGVCMGRQYPAAHRRFMALSVPQREAAFADILAFMQYAAAENYVALDFYDGSILYDFDRCKAIVCDIDFFRKSPAVNDMGRMWGSASFMSPEEFCLGAPLDEVTNVYTHGAMAFALFGNYKRDRASWTLTQNTYNVAARAVSDDRRRRYSSIAAFAAAWQLAG